MIDISIRNPEHLDSQMIEALYQLHASFFCNSDRELFLSDLHEKDLIIIAIDDESPVAFSTIRIHDETVSGERILFLFSGDTIVHPEYWKSNILVPAFAAFLDRMMEQHPGVRIYWYLITKGHRTYMFLPVLFNEFYPTPDRPTPPDVQKLIDYISEKRFGRNYNRDTGIISFNGRRDRLSDELGKVPELRAKNRYIGFFLKANPMFSQGDELACLTAIDRANIKPAGLKLLEFRDMRWET